jgi:hypothetical protein
MRAFRRLFEDQHLGPEVVGGDGSREPGRPDTADHDIGFEIPVGR